LLACIPEVVDQPTKMMTAAAAVGAQTLLVLVGKVAAVTASQGHTNGAAQFVWLRTASQDTLQRHTCCQ